MRSYIKSPEKLTNLSVKSTNSSKEVKKKEGEVKEKEELRN